MGSYAEQVVDQGVAQAWLTFRLRLADHLTDAIVTSPEVSIAPQGAGGHEQVPAIAVTADGEDIVVRIETGGSLVGRFRFSAAQRWRLAELGMTISGGGPVLFVSAAEVDRAAHYVYVVLHEMWHVVHPSFLDVDPEDLVLADRPEAAESSGPVDLPDLIRTGSAEALNHWIDATLTPEFGHAPHRDADGDICVTGDMDARAVVSVRSENRIEIWTILARDVSRKKARRKIDLLSRTYSFHRFFLVKDMLIASIVLFADPFVPEQLVQALRGTLFVSGRLSGLAVELEAPYRRDDAPDAIPDPDTHLMSLFVSSRRMPTADLVETAMNLASGSSQTLDTWRSRAVAAHDQAKAVFRRNGDVRDVHRRSVSAWRRVIRALDLALAEVSPGSRDAA